MGQRVAKLATDLARAIHDTLWDHEDYRDAFLQQAARVFAEREVLDSLVCEGGLLALRPAPQNAQERALYAIGRKLLDEFLSPDGFLLRLSSDISCLARQKSQDATGSVLSLAGNDLTLPSLTTQDSQALDLLFSHVLDRPVEEVADMTTLCEMSRLQWMCALQRGALLVARDVQAQCALVRALFRAIERGDVLTVSHLLPPPDTQEYAEYGISPVPDRPVGPPSNNEHKTPRTPYEEWIRLPVHRRYHARVITVDCRDSSRCTPLMAACHFGELACMQYILFVGGADVMARDRLQWTALMHSARQGYTSVVETLLSFMQSRPLPPVATLQVQGDTLLWGDRGDSAPTGQARQRPSQPLVLCLRMIARGVFARCGGNTSQSGVQEMTEWVRQGLDAVNDNKCTALMCAAHAGHSEACQALVRAGCDVTLQSQWGDSALHIAATAAQLDVVRVLVESSSLSRALNSPGRHGRTALAMAAAANDLPHWKVFIYLIGKGARVDFLDSTGACLCGRVGGERESPDEPSSQPDRKETEQQICAFCTSLHQGMQLYAKLSAQKAAAGALARVRHLEGVVALLRERVRLAEDAEHSSSEPGEPEPSSHHEEEEVRDDTTNECDTHAAVQSVQPTVEPVVDSGRLAAVTPPPAISEPKESGVAVSSSDGTGRSQDTSPSSGDEPAVTAHDLPTTSQRAFASRGSTTNPFTSRAATERSHPTSVPERPAQSGSWSASIYNAIASPLRVLGGSRPAACTTCGAPGCSNPFHKLNNDGPRAPAEPTAPAERPVARSATLSSSPPLLHTVTGVIIPSPGTSFRRTQTRQSPLSDEPDYVTPSSSFVDVSAVSLPLFASFSYGGEQPEALGDARGDSPLTADSPAKSTSHNTSPSKTPAPTPMPTHTQVQPIPQPDIAGAAHSSKRSPQPNTRSPSPDASQEPAHSLSQQENRLPGSQVMRSQHLDRQQTGGGAVPAGPGFKFRSPAVVIGKPPATRKAKHGRYGATLHTRSTDSPPAVPEACTPSTWKLLKDAMMSGRDGMNGVLGLGPVPGVHPRITNARAAPITTPPAGKQHLSSHLQSLTKGVPWSELSTLTVPEAVALFGPQDGQDLMAAVRKSRARTQRGAHSKTRGGSSVLVKKVREDALPGEVKKVVRDAAPTTEVNESLMGAITAAPAIDTNAHPTRTEQTEPQSSPHTHTEEQEVVTALPSVPPSEDPVPPEITGQSGPREHDIADVQTTQDRTPQDQRVTEADETNPSVEDSTVESQSAAQVDSPENNVVSSIIAQEHSAVSSTTPPQNAEGDHVSSDNSPPTDIPPADAKQDNETEIEASDDQIGETSPASSAMTNERTPPGDTDDQTASTEPQSTGGSEGVVDVCSVVAEGGTTDTEGRTSEGGTAEGGTAEGGTAEGRTTPLADIQAAASREAAPAGAAGAPVRDSALPEQRATVSDTQPPSISGHGQPSARSASVAGDQPSMSPPGSTEGPPDIQVSVTPPQIRRETGDDADPPLTALGSVTTLGSVQLSPRPLPPPQKGSPMYHRLHGTAPQDLGSPVTLMSSAAEDSADGSGFGAASPVEHSWDAPGLSEKERRRLHKKEKKRKKKRKRKKQRKAAAMTTKPVQPPAVQGQGSEQETAGMQQQPPPTAPSEQQHTDKGGAPDKALDRVSYRELTPAPVWPGDAPSSRQPESKTAQTQAVSGGGGRQVPSQPSKRTGQATGPRSLDTGRVAVRRGRVASHGPVSKSPAARPSSGGSIWSWGRSALSAVFVPTGPKAKCVAQIYEEQQ